MSGALINASRLKAEIRLAQAVSQFEADLSNDQKAMFRSYKTQSHHNPPTPDDVMLLTALIDRGTNGNISGGRCFGPRFSNLLQAVQQFAALGDIIIGGSQNLIACGVWSLVRMTLLMIVTSTSYLEKLSSLFMTVGRSAPRYQSMALLYPRSKVLQSSLSEYFIVVVHLCHQLVKFTQKSTLGQMVSSLSDSDIKSAEAQLITWANMIKEEVALLLSQKIEEEAQENSRFRAVSNLFSETASYRKKLQRNRRVLDACSIYDYETTWKQIRKLGNATLLDSAPEYRDWKVQESSCTLICMGKLGSGKSVLLANAVDDLHLHVQNKKIPVAYFFCRHDIPESLRTRTVIGSLARQLLCTVSDLSAAEELLDEISPAPNVENICNLLRRVLSSKDKAYFILDGLDECSEGDRQALVNQLKGLQEAFSFSVCVSYRLQVGSTSLPEPLIQSNVISIPDSNPDIEGYIAAELENSLKRKTLSIRDPALILEIQDALLKGAQGMFLWVTLQLKSLWTERTDEAIRQALVNLPKDLPETFSRILKRSKNSTRPYQQLILELVTVAERPLTKDELGEALSVVPGDTTWNPARLINDLDSTLACCGSLVIVDEEELTVRLVHHSVKQFLLGGAEGSTGIPFTFQNAHARMGDIAVTYLNYGIFETQLSSVVIPEIMAESAPSKILRSSLHSSSIVRSLALQLLASKNEPDFNIGKVLAGANQHFRVHSTNEHYFYAYAQYFWPYHTWALATESGHPTYNLLCKMIKEGTCRSIGPDNRESNHIQLMQALRHGSEGIVRIILEYSNLDINSQVEHGQTPLMIAIRHGHEGIVKLLLNNGGFDAELMDENDETLLMIAIRHGHEGIVKLLLKDSRFDAEWMNENGQTPLMIATRHGHEGIVKLLLEDGRFDAKLMDKHGHTLLLIAGENGHRDIVELLLNNPRVGVSYEQDHGRTPLLESKNRREGLVKLLINSSEVDVALRNHFQFDWALENQDAATVKLLLDNSKVDANFHCPSEYYRTPLARAAFSGHVALVEMLLDHIDRDKNSSNVDLRDDHGQTPLALAASQGNEDVVKLLLATKKFDNNQKDDYGCTPLLLAARNGHEAVVKLLLDTNDVDVNATEHYRNRTALSFAAMAGHESVVKLLLDTCKSEVSKLDAYGKTASRLALEGGYITIVNLLERYQYGLRNRSCPEI